MITFPRFAALLLGVFLAAAAASSDAAETKRPNVLMIVGDDWGWGDYGFMGHPTIKTPHLDRLAKSGVVFSNAYVPNSLCRPSLATMLTGMYPHQHKIFFNDPPDGVDRTTIHCIDSLPTIPRQLKTAGYRSFQTGKFWEGHHENGGFTEGMTVKGRHGDDGLVIGRKTLQPIYDFLEKGHGEPFFIWYAPMMPHMPHDPPQRLIQKYTAPDRDPAVAKYWAMCEWTDETVGELLEYFDKHKLTENTLILFLADNGWLQPIGNAAKTTGARGAPRGKNTPYEGGVRGPFILNWPGKLPSARRTDLVSSIDLAPTVLSACGVEVPKNMVGQSLLDVAAGKGKFERDVVFGELYLHSAKEVGQPLRSLTHRWVRSGDWKLVLPAEGSGAGELFDVAKDPTEMKNLAQEQPEQVKRLTGLIDAEWARTPIKD